jgi:hypothetical protein
MKRDVGLYIFLERQLNLNASLQKHRKTLAHMIFPEHDESWLGIWK